MEVLNEWWLQVILMAALIVGVAELILWKKYSNVSVRGSSNLDIDNVGGALDEHLNSELEKIRQNTRLSYVFAVIIFTGYLCFNPITII
jgi:hypothetical protein